MKNIWRTFGKDFSFHWQLLGEVLLFLKAPVSSLGKGEVQECVQSEVWGNNRRLIGAAKEGGRRSVGLQL